MRVNMWVCACVYMCRFSCSSWYLTTRYYQRPFLAVGGPMACFMDESAVTGRTAAGRGPSKPCTYDMYRRPKGFEMAPGRP